LNQKKREDEESGDDRADDKTVYLRVDDELRVELEKIISWMKTDPKVRRLKINKIGRAKALRYAVGHLIEHPPEHVGAAR
jgi:hypothetical protein